MGLHSVMSCHTNVILYFPWNIFHKSNENYVYSVLHYNHADWGGLTSIFFYFPFFSHLKITAFRKILPFETDTKGGATSWSGLGLGALFCSLSPASDISVTLTPNQNIEKLDTSPIRKLDRSEVKFRLRINLSHLATK